MNFSSPPIEEIQVVGTAIIRKPVHQEVMDAWWQQNMATPAETRHYQEQRTQAKKIYENKLREICTRIYDFYNEYAKVFAEAYDNSEHSELKPRHYVSFYTAVTIYDDWARISEVALKGDYIVNEKAIHDIIGRVRACAGGDYSESATFKKLSEQVFQNFTQDYNNKSYELI
jgi:hypothetical protein